MSDAPEVASNAKCACGHDAFHHRRADGVCLYQRPGGHQCGCQRFQLVPQTNQQPTGTAEYPDDSEGRLNEIEQRLGELESNHASIGGGADDRLNEIERRLDELESDGQPEELESSRTSEGGVIGYGLGMCIAVVLSWSRNGSILWCILHGLLSWVYVIYFAVTR
jgi:hypothetical protein